MLIANLPHPLLHAALVLHSVGILSVDGCEKENGRLFFFSLFSFPFWHRAFSGFFGPRKLVGWGVDAYMDQDVDKNKTRGGGRKSTERGNIHAHKQTRLPNRDAEPRRLSKGEMRYRVRARIAKRGGMQGYTSLFLQKTFAPLGFLGLSSHQSHPLVCLIEGFYLYSPYYLLHPSAPWGLRHVASLVAPRPMLIGLILFHHSIIRQSYVHDGVRRSGLLALVGLARLALAVVSCLRIGSSGAASIRELGQDQDIRVFRLYLIPEVDGGEKSASNGRSQSSIRISCMDSSNAYESLVLAKNTLPSFAPR